jgi:hypothetical protein
MPQTVTMKYMKSLFNSDLKSKLNSTVFSDVVSATTGVTVRPLKSRGRGDGEGDIVALYCTGADSDSCRHPRKA